jgi:outer membrane protein
MKQIFSVLTLVLFMFTNSYSQKFGYLNTQELLLSMPELKIADIQLDALQKELISKGEEMVVRFEADYKAYMNEANSGTLSKVQMQQKEEVLIAKQDELKQYETDIQNRLAIKREELYKPILDKVKMEIEKLGKEGNYTMIFDTAQGMILHAAENEDLLQIMKTKLGVN